jgi:3-phosphoshikimate 1-carboxyvinyltransferase
MSDVAVPPIHGPFDAAVTPPGSKSLTNRALVLAALADGPCRVSNALLADDTAVMLDGVRQLGLDVAVDGTVVTVVGQAGRVPAASAELACGNSGTTIRFLSAVAALGHGTFTLDGVARMRRRPIGELGDVLAAQGTAVEYLGEAGYPPVRLAASGLAGGRLSYGTAQSSQFLSAVLMAAPRARDELVVTLDGPQTSWPYVAMTMRMMDLFGVTPLVERHPSTGQPKELIIPTGTYAATDYAVEPDASAAAYFWAAAALHPGGRATVAGLGTQSLQGDVAITDVLRRMGATIRMSANAVTVVGADQLAGVDADLSAIPDQAQTIGVVALFAHGATRLSGLRTLRVKETDRLAAMATELSKFGAAVTVDGDDAITIDPPAAVRAGVAVDTYDDHRMAMSFALAGTRVGVLIRDGQCVGKTYPDFFRDLERLRG